MLEETVGEGNLDTQMDQALAILEATLPKLQQWSDATRVSLETAKSVLESAGSITGQTGVLLESIEKMLPLTALGAGADPGGVW